MEERWLVLYWDAIKVEWVLHSQFLHQDRLVAEQETVRVRGLLGDDRKARLLHTADSTL